MCRLKSAIILQDRVYIPDHDSHSIMLEELGIEDTRQNAEKLFVRAELVPKYIFDPVDEWTYIVDQDILPDWYVAEYDKQRMIDAVKEWAKDHIHQGVDKLTIQDSSTHYCKDCTNLVIHGGTAYISGGTAYIYGGTAYIYGGRAYIYGGRAYISGGTAYIYGGRSYISGGTADIHSGMVNIYGGTADIRGGMVDIRGGMVNIYGGTADIHSGMVNIYGGTADIRGGMVNIYGGTADMHNNSVGIIRTTARVDISRITLSDNATLKDCRTKTIYQSGDWQYKTIDNRGDNNGD